MRNYLIQIATKTFNNDESYALKWLDSPQFGLNNETPFNYATTEEKLLDVIQLLGRIEHGVYS
jgi:uncharacterized protein (DUF2384 family)